MTNLKYHYSSFSIKTIPNDVLISILSYLADSNNYPFAKSDTNVLDYFTVELYKSNIPATLTASYLQILTTKTLADKYAAVKASQAIAGSSIIVGIDDTSTLAVGLSVVGEGIPNDSYIQSIRDKNSLKLNANATITGSPSLTISTRGWNIDYADLNLLLTQINFGSI